MRSQESPAEIRSRRAIWVALRVMPHEAQARGWLRRARATHEEADDFIQEAYCRLSLLDEVNHIDHPGAYFFSIVRNLLIKARRAAPVVSLEDITELESISDPDVCPELEAARRIDAARVHALIGELPERCRRIVEMRKLEGYSQREIAQMLGVTESVVENNIYRGMKAILGKWAERGFGEEDSSRMSERNKKGLSR